MQELYKQKLSYFANDPELMDAVYEVLLNNLLKEKSQHEVYIAAAERIAVDCLKRAWREIENYKVKKQEPVENKTPHI